MTGIASQPPVPSGFATSPAERRFTFVDSLRGVAALGVLLYHLIPWEPQADGSMAGGTLTRVVTPVVKHGAEGVTIFFVISGFVIAYSLRNAWITPRFFGNFVLRRSVRLDPPYWTTIVLVIALKALSARFFPSIHWEPPSVAQVAAHLVYLQNILGYGDLCSIFWTLCLEVQFYLLYIVLLGLLQSLCARTTRATFPTGIGPWLIFLPLGLASLVYFQHAESGIDRHAWFLGHFHKFLLGASVAWTLMAREHRPLFWVFVACFVGETTLHEYDLATAVAAVTAVGIYVLASRSWLSAPLENRLLRYFGKISYSLYLVHIPIGFSAWMVGRRLAKGSPWQEDMWAGIAILSSIVAAHVMYVLIESNSVKLSQWLKPARSEPAPTDHLQPVRISDA